MLCKVRVKPEGAAGGQRHGSNCGTWTRCSNPPSQQKRHATGDRRADKAEEVDAKCQRTEGLDQREQFGGEDVRGVARCMQDSEHRDSGYAFRRVAQAGVVGDSGRKHGAGA